MQKITREALTSIYKDVCEGWQSNIDALLNNQKFSTTIEVPDSLIQEALNAASKNSHMNWLKKNFKLPKDLKSEIKDIEDIFRLSGKHKEDVLTFSNPNTKKRKVHNAIDLIDLITSVYNNGTKLDWENTSQPKYYLWWRKVIGDGWVLYVCDYCYYYAGLPSGSFFARREDALDAAAKFKDIWIDYLPE